MKILLIYPYCLETRLHAEEVSVPPIGIYYVGAILKENHYDVEILNWHNINETPQLIRETLVEKAPDIIGFSILHANRWGGIEIARIAKEINPDLDQERILAFGQRLRSEYHKSLPEFVDSIELIEKKELFKMHADFLSRLGMTFSYGDYAMIEAIREKDKIAERLFKRSLAYYPDHRAYLGLGMSKQSERAFEESIRVLSEGTAYFPESTQLNICLGISYMNHKEYDKALSCFLKFQYSKEAVYYTVGCYEALGDAENQATFLEKLRFLQEETV